MINKIETYDELEKVLKEYLERMGEDNQWY
jgi:hypothetical protein